MPIVYSLKIHEEAVADLEDLWRTDPASAGALVALLQQIKADQRLLDSLTIHGFGSDRREAFNVVPWIEQRRLGRELWRLKHWVLEGKARRYRVIYALDSRASRYYVLGVFSRDFNYDRNDPRTRRVLVTYDSMDLPGHQ